MTYNKRSTNSIETNQSGLVSIIVTGMIMLVVTLIALTFANIIRREQRQALDRQLNTQAFYAAESGVNAAIEELKSGSFAKTQCNDPAELGVPGAITGANTTIDAANDVSFTCLTINPVPISLEFDEIDTNKSTTIPVISGGGTNLISITVSWQEKGGSVAFDCGVLASPLNFPSSGGPLPAGCGTGILRLDVVPTNSLDRLSLLSNNKTVFLVPKSAAGSSTLAYPFTSGDIVPISCSTGTVPKFCQVTINLPNNSSEYYLRARSIYASSALTVTAKDSIGSVGLKDVQVLVDSTGKANDVLRRIQVRVPLDKSISIPDFALQSTDTICKRLDIDITGNANYNSTGVPTGGAIPQLDDLPCNYP